MNKYKVTVRAVVYQTFEVEAYNFDDLKWQAEEEFNLYARRKTTDVQDIELCNFDRISQPEAV